MLTDTLPSTAASGSSALGSYISDVNETDLLDAEQERDVAFRIQDGDIEARDHLIRANLRLVIRIARQFANRGVALEDLIQEGTLGLMRAVEAFEPERGLRFSTYAKFWITQSMQHVVRTSSRTVRIPPYAADLVAKWRRTAAQLAQETGEAPSDDAIADRLAIAPKLLKIVKKALRIFQGASNAAEERPLLEVVDQSAQPQANVLRSDDLDKVMRLIEGMDPRAASLLKMRFGLEGEAPLNLEQIGQRLGLTRERVRQLEKQALACLREHMDNVA